MKIYRISNNKNEAEWNYYKSVGGDLLSELKSSIKNIVGGTLDVKYERSCINVPSNVKWYEKEYNLKNVSREMSRLKAEISGVKLPFDLYYIIVFVGVDSDGNFLYSGDVYEKEYNKDIHEELDEDAKKRPSWDVSNIITRHNIDNVPLGFFGKTVAPESFKLSYGYAKSADEAAELIKKIIFSSDNDIEDFPINMVTSPSELVNM